MLQEKFEIHEICELFPAMLDDQFIALKRDIRENGLVEPGIVYEGKVLDGRHRYKACQELGVEFKYEVLDDRDFDPVKYVLSKNLHRRHLSKSQWAMVGADLRKYFDKQAKERQGSRNDLQSNIVEKLPPCSKSYKARDEAGKVVGVSGKMIDFATIVKTMGCPEIQIMVKDGQVSVAKAAEICKQTDIFSEQIKLAQAEIDSHYKRKPKTTGRRIMKVIAPVFTEEEMANSAKVTDAMPAILEPVYHSYDNDDEVYEDYYDDDDDYDLSDEEFEGDVVDEPENFNSLIYAWRATRDKFQAVLTLAELLTPSEQQRLKDSI